MPEGPVGRGVSVGFDDLGREFDPGEVTVTVEVSGPDGDLVAVTRRPVGLRRTFPNGQACDGDGYVAGTLELTSRDRV